MATTDLHLFDVCVITVSDEQSVSRISALVERRQAAGLYPREIQFRVYADPPAGRIGSGGGTMWALLQLLEDEARGDAGSTAGRDAISGAAEYFAGKRIVLLHAGGESRRLPCYAPEGKLFAPIPLATSSVLSPVVLDAQLSLFLKYPWRDGELLVGSGDVVIDFDTSAMKRPTAPITGFGAPAPLAQGARHGVFRFDPSGERVEEYYQKQPAEFLAEHARIEGTDQCALDIGLISMAPELTSEIVEIGRQLRGKLAQAQVYVDVYLEILTACLSGISEEDYLRRIGLQSRADASVREAIYARLHPFALGGILTREPKFIHFGSLAEFPAACRELSRSELLPFYAPERGELAPTCLEPALVFNTGGGGATDGAVDGGGPLGSTEDGGGSVDAAPAGAYVENCGALNGVRLGNRSGLVGVSEPAALPPIPPSIWVDERRTDVGMVFLTYGIGDTFKRTEDLSKLLFCGVPMDRWLDERGLTPRDIWDRTEIGDLWTARLFSPKVSAQQLAWYWDAESRQANNRSTGEREASRDGSAADGGSADRGAGGRSAAEDGSVASERSAAGGAPAAGTAAGREPLGDFRSLRRLSLRELNSVTDPRRRDEDRAGRRRTLLRAHLLAGRGWRTVSAADFCEIFPDRRVPERLLAGYTATIDPLLAAYRRRVIERCGSLPKRLGEAEAERNIRYVTPTRDSFPLRRAVKDDQLVWARCPVRLDLAGGWTDTPPYTNRYGGKVVNVAADLNGEPPIQVYCRPTKERHVRFHSIDLGVTETLTTAGEILDFRNPSSPFALPKAALVLLGVVDDSAGRRSAGPRTAGDEDRDELAGRLERIGSGVEVTLMCAVPKGSGLGTSSILGGTILAALARFLGVEMTRDELYLNVLAMEQMLTTGGGWQDQVGGIAGSVKYVESVAGMRPQPEVHQLDPYLFSAREHTERMTLFYTGITRLAKNILQEVVDRVNDFEPAYLFTHRHLAELASDARRIIALRDYAGLCRIVAASWQGNKLVHESTTNEEIESILAATADSYAAVKLLGAGGGGYALFLSPTVRDADQLRETLATRFDNGRSRLVEFGLNPEGLRVSVS